jgi:hypothetical protein
MFDAKTAQSIIRQNYDDGVIANQDGSLSTRRLAIALRDNEIVIPGWHAIMEDVSDAKLMRRNGGQPFVQIMLYSIGYDLDFVTGPKTGNFQGNMLGNFQLTTVDSHAVLGVTGAYDVGGSWRMTAKIFSHADRLYRLWADVIGVEPAIAQAISWVGKKYAFDNLADMGIVAPSAIKLYANTISGSNGYNMPANLYYDNASVDNLQYLYDRMPSDVMAHGVSWYPDAHRTTLQHARSFDLVPETFAAIIAILSPGREWGDTHGDGNMADAVRTTQIMLEHGVPIR